MNINAAAHKILPLWEKYANINSISVYPCTLIFYSISCPVWGLLAKTYHNNVLAYKRKFLHWQRGSLAWACAFCLLQPTLVISNTDISK